MTPFHRVAIKPYDSTQQLGNDLRHLGLGSSDRSIERRMSICGLCEDKTAFIIE